MILGLTSHGEIGNRKYLSSCCSVTQCLALVTPWTAACQASLSFTLSQSLPKLMSIESVMPSSHLIVSHSLLLLLSILPSITVFGYKRQEGDQTNQFLRKSVLNIHWKN